MKTAVKNAYIQNGIHLQILIFIKIQSQVDRWIDGYI